MINLDYASRTPIYKQIVEQIEKFIALGILKPNQQLSSIRELAVEVGINPNTVKKAYTELETKGVIKTISTKGTFVSESIENIIQEQIEEKIDKIKKTIIEIEQMGLDKEDIIKKIL